jgi:hypothetical protein
MLGCRHSEDRPFAILAVSARMGTQIASGSQCGVTTGGDSSAKAATAGSRQDDAGAMVILVTIEFQNAETVEYLNTSMMISVFADDRQIKNADVINVTGAIKWVRICLSCA